MKKFVILSILFALSACGTIGIGSNHETRLYNNSKNTITVSADSGVYKIKPEQDMVIFSNNDLTIKSSNSACSEKTVMRELNAPAVILDVLLPTSWFVGVLPVLFVDAISNNMYRMPEAYSYSCIE
ncbi:MAG: hypothetical protein ACLRFK_03075 [Alphaproteobacteria bacterium]